MAGKQDLKITEAPSPIRPHSQNTSTKINSLKFQDGNSGALNQAWGPV